MLDHLDGRETWQVVERDGADRAERDLIARDLGCGGIVLDSPGR